jgi:hypothetical protein
MVYQPMLELLAYLRANGFKTYIVSGGGIEFMRPWTEKVYGVPPEQVIGSSIKTKYEVRDGKPVLVRLPETQLHRRQGGQAGRHQPADRSPTDRRVSAIPTAICRCCNGRLPAPGRASRSSSTIPMPNANGLTTASRTSASSTRRSTKRKRAVGRWWI